MTLTETQVSTVEKTVFVVSVAVLAFLLGFATHTFRWFPTSFLERAWLQADRAASRAQARPSWVAPRVHDWSGVRVHRPESVQPGPRLISSLWQDDGWTAGLRLIDSHGRLLHEWRIDPDELFPDSAMAPGIGRKRIRYVHGSHLFPDGDLLVNVESRGTARLDACGRALWRLPAGSHHSIARAEDGSFWIPARRWEAPPASRARPDGFPGLQQPGYHDRILNVSPTGEVRDTISVLDVLYDNGLQRYVAKAEQLSSDDVTHLNDVEPLSASTADEYPLFEPGDLLVSLRNLNLVLVVDPATGDVEWRASESFIQQHDPDFSGGGWVGVFDNNADGTRLGTLAGGSRIVEVRPHTDSTRVVYPTPRSDPFHTRVGGKWQRLANDNLLLTETRAGRIVEVGPDGRTVWEWINRPYDGSYVPEVYSGTLYALTHEDVAAWPCSPGGGDSSSSGDGGAPR